MILELYETVKAATGVALFVAFVIAADRLVTAFQVPVPPAVLAMLSLAVVFSVLPKVPTVLDMGAALLFRIFPLLFIPPLVGIVQVLDLVATHWMLLLFAVTLSSLLGVGVSALLYRALRSKKRHAL